MRKKEEERTNETRKKRVGDAKKAATSRKRKTLRMLVPNSFEKGVKHGREEGAFASGSVAQVHQKRNSAQAVNTHHLCPHWHPIEKGERSFLGLNLQDSTRVDIPQNLNKKVERIKKKRTQNSLGWLAGENVIICAPITKFDGLKPRRVFGVYKRCLRSYVLEPLAASLGDFWCTPPLRQSDNHKERTNFHGMETIGVHTLPLASACPALLFTIQQLRNIPDNKLF